MATNNTTPKSKKAKKGIFDSIKTKLILVMLAAAAIPLLIVMIVNYKTSTNKALADAQSTLEAQARYISAEYSGVLQENVDMVRSIAENPTTIVYMEGTAGIEDDVMIQMMQAADKILDDGSVMAIADASGMQIVSPPVIA